jgi:AraC-like DNA-binding protein
MNLDDLSSTEIENLINEYVHDKTYREILKARLIDNIKYDDLALMFNYSVRHIKRIVYKAQDKFYRHL